MLTAGMVVLTMALLGVSFYALSYNYTVSEKRQEMQDRAVLVAQLSVDYFTAGDDAERDQGDALRSLAGVASRMTDVDFLICDTTGSVLLTTDADLAGKTVVVPEDITQTVLGSERLYEGRSTVGVYEKKQFVVGVPMTDADGNTLGLVLAVMNSAELMQMWRSFIALFFMTSAIILLLAFVASFVTSMRQIQPLTEMVKATRAYAGGDFDVRMQETGDCGEISELAAALDGVYDLERLMTRVVYGNPPVKDMIALGATTARLPAIKELLGEVQCALLREIEQNIDPLEDVARLIGSAIDPDSDIPLKEGGVIREGYDKQLDEARHLSKNIRGILAEIEEREKDATGIRTLRIGYNRVFGYYIEVSNSFKDQVPAHYIRKQTLTNAERYITEEIKELEERVLHAQQEAIDRAAELYEQVRATVAAELPRIQQTAAAVAGLDMLCSLATVALNNNYCCPTVDLSDEIEISEGRHPVVEQLLDGAPFVPNDTKLNNRENQIAVLTGPNMAGKSTYMRQVALIVLMAQVGSFVPAASARIGIVDGIYTRVGASDDLTTGQSTFMVEMSEVANILKEATEKSLLILDEIGRGTSTYDGMSIARAVIEYIADRKKLGAKTLFATHYHELTELEELIPCVKNYNVAVKKRGEDIVFLRRIIPGGVDESYGIEVSKLAGIPRWVIDRAYEVLSSLEEGQTVSEAKVKTRAKPKEESEQLYFIDEKAEAIKKRLRGADPNTLTPIEALNLIYELKKLL